MASGGGQNSETGSGGATTTLEKVYWRDNDGDGYPDPNDRWRGSPDEVPPGYVEAPSSDDLWPPVDCDDTNAEIHPDATEVCNGIDDDCDEIGDPIGPDCFEATRLFPGESHTCFEMTDGRVACTKAVKEDDSERFETRIFPGVSEPDMVWWVSITDEACALKEDKIICWDFDYASAYVFIDLAEQDAFTLPLLKVDMESRSPASNTEIRATPVSVIAADGNVYRYSYYFGKGYQWDQILADAVDIQYTRWSFCYLESSGLSVCVRNGVTRSSASPPYPLVPFISDATFLPHGLFSTEDGVVAAPFDPETDLPTIYQGTHGAVEAADDGGFVCARSESGDVKCDPPLPELESSQVDGLSTGVGLCALNGGAIDCYRSDGTHISLPAPRLTDEPARPVFGLGEGDGACDNPNDSSLIGLTTNGALSTSLIECAIGCVNAFDESTCIADCEVPEVTAECYACIETGLLCVAKQDGVRTDSCVESYAACSGQTPSPKS